MRSLFTARVKYISLVMPHIKIDMYNHNVSDLYQDKNQPKKTTTVTTSGSVSPEPQQPCSTSCPSTSPSSPSPSSPNLSSCPKLYTVTQCALPASSIPSQTQPSMVSVHSSVDCGQLSPVTVSNQRNPRPKFLALLKTYSL